MRLRHIILFLLMAVSVTPIRAGISTDYLLGGSLTLKNGRIDKYYFEGGFARAFETSATTDRFVFYYYNKDHLGNNREVVDIKGRIHQVTNYYPFGAPYADENAIKGESLQPYKYNGKELDLMHGLNTYDYGARQYDPILARWDRVDPLAEDEPDISPYVYCRNNPIIHIDQEGKFPLVSNVAGAIVGAATDYVCQVAANAIVNEGLSTECFTDVDSKSIMLSAGAGFISSGASAVGTSLGKAVATRTGSRIAGNIAERAAAEGTKYTANVVANNGDITKATKDYVVGKAVGLLNRKTVNPTSNNKAVKTAMERAKNNGKTLSVEQKKAIRIGNTMARKNASKMNKSIECKNTIKKTAVDAAYYTYKHYEEKENR